VTNLIFGSGDSDSYVYDPNTGRMKQYQFTVNGQSAVGNLTWNANGTLASLNTTDPFNSGNNQTCTYAYDDLARLSSVNCPNVWSQTFSYDPFGNITKNGSYWWTPGYNSATNRYTLAGTSYDNNGDLTNDTFHTYQWDAEGNITAVDVGGSNYTDYLTYDALGNTAEYKQTYANGNPPWLAQLVYGVQGRAHADLGKTIASGGGNTFTLPLVGGASMAGWSSSSTTVYGHSDWQGSIRLNSTPSRTVNSDAVFAPFGEVYNSPTTWWYEFAGLKSSLTSNVWDADYRHYHADQGRWLSPDPAGFAAADPSNPQSWNRYSYVMNDPMDYVDPSGLHQCPNDQSWGAQLCRMMLTSDGLNPFSTWNPFSLLFTTGCSESGCVTTIDPNAFNLLGLGGNSSGGANNAKPSCFPTSSLNWSQKAQLLAAQFYASLTGWTFGFGAGLDAGAGIGPKGSSWNFGVGGSASTLIVADASGNSGFLNSASGGFSAIKMSSAGSWWGAGAAAGPSVLVSPNAISRIAGPSGSFSAGGGAVLGAGISVTTSGAATVTFGVGAGAEGGVSPQFGKSQFIPFCHN